MNKKIIIIFICMAIAIVLCYLLINNKKGENINLEVISNYLEIEISENAKIEYINDHDSFFNEGYTIMKISDDNLLNKIKQSPNWRDGTDNYTSKINGIKNTMKSTYNEISEIQNYCWIYKHNYKDANQTKYIEQIGDDNAETYSYLVGIYDIDNDILYYYHMDM